jgi:hypothetical protein
MTPAARNLVVDLEGAGCRVRFLIQFPCRQCLVFSAQPVIE